MLLDGLHIPLTTPFYPDGRLYLRKLEHNVDRYSRTPAAGMVATGATGEGAALSDADTREVWATAIAAAAPEKVMLAAIARDGVAPALDLIDIAATLGFDAVLLTRPAAYLGSNRETILFFQTVADRAALPLVLHSSRHRPLDHETVAQLAPHPGLLGIVDEDGRIAAIREATAGVKRQATVTTVFAAVTGRMVARAAAPAPGSGSYIGIESLTGGGTAVAAPVAGPALKTRLRETGFQVLGARASTLLADLAAGAAGATPPLAAAAPQACFEVFAGWKDGDRSLAEEKQARLLEAAAQLEDRLGVPGLKYACDLNGYFGGRPRLPLVMASGAERAEIDRLMRGMRN